MSDLPDLLQLTDIGERRYQVFQPSESAEGRDVVFSGQLLAQMIMASDRSADGAKDVRSVHAVFARAGTYAQPIELEVESLQAGRTWASDTVTATQAGKLLSRATVLLNVVDEDLMRHEPQMPAVPGPADLEAAPGQAFPGAELRPVPGQHEAGGIPVEMAWHRFERRLAPQAANQAVLTWATCGNIIGLGMRPHRDRSAHRGRSRHDLDRRHRPHDALRRSVRRLAAAAPSPRGHEGRHRPGLRRRPSVHRGWRPRGRVPPGLHGQGSGRLARSEEVHVAGEVQPDIHRCIIWCSDTWSKTRYLGGRRR